MQNILHITSGDSAGDLLKQAGLPGEVLVWHDLLYEGPRNPGWPTEETLRARSRFLEASTAGGLPFAHIIKDMHAQYQKLSEAENFDRIILWFDACLFDQSMLCHILCCLHHQRRDTIDLLCVDAFPGIEPFHGLGQLSVDQLASLWGKQKLVRKEQIEFATRVDEAFATQNPETFQELAQLNPAPLPYIPRAIQRWLQEQPDALTGLGKLETLALEAIAGGKQTPGEIFKSVASADTPPQYWGDTTLWAKINRLADRKPPLVRIEGPEKHLPQWTGAHPLKTFKVTAC
ncbi:DUF1835 domain-containing protein [Kiritimatiellaeota bacterium B1221]|nr:DUF1835 domain-containing protein [Kiritimatiellaeota bacterium B1221]